MCTVDVLQLYCIGLTVSEYLTLVRTVDVLQLYCNNLSSPNHFTPLSLQEGVGGEASFSHSSFEGLGEAFV